MSALKAFKIVSEAMPVYKSLNGVFLVYKPPHLHFNRMRETIIKNLCRGYNTLFVYRDIILIIEFNRCFSILLDLNDMKVRPQLKHVCIEGKTNENLRVYVRDSFADHPLVIGPRYQPNDFKLGATKIMHEHVSGIIVCGINKGNKIIHKMKLSKCVRFYRVTGLLGEATDNYFHTGRVVEKSKFTHVKRGHIDKLCNSMQSSHQRKMFDLCGVDIQSQAAYELALQGPLRPTDPNIPLLYTIKCVDFSPPKFTLEIVCTQEYDMYLKTVIHDIGMKLHTNATCIQIQCVQDGVFNINDALLPKHWTLDNIVHNMQICQDVINKNPNLLKPESAALAEYNGNATEKPTIET
ncbi:Pseudouridylate synthase TRUB2, mitochondrial [Anthophora quadrimaculata]